MTNRLTFDTAPRHAAAAPSLVSPSTFQAFLFLVFLTVTLTWPQVAHLCSIPDNSDSYFSLWRIGWIAHALPSHAARLFDGNIFYPTAHTLTFSDAVLLEGIIAAPLIWLGVPIVLVYNLLVLGSFVLCGIGTFLLVRHLSGRADAALLAAIVFSFASYRFDHYFHLELLWAQWMPLTLWMLHRTLETGRIRDGLLTGVFLGAQGLSCIYYTVFFATVLVVLVPVLLMSARKELRRNAALALIGGALVAAAVVGPYALAYRSAQNELGEREPGHAVLYGVGPKHYLAATPDNLLYGSTTAALGRHEKRLFFGLMAAALAGVGLWPPFDRRRVAYLLALLVAVSISLGSTSPVYAWLREHVVLYRGLRVPARIGHVVLLCVAVFTGFGASRIARQMDRWRPRWRAIVLASIATVMVAEYLVAPRVLIPLASNPSDAYLWLRNQPAGVVAEMPMPLPTSGAVTFDAEFEFLSTFHWYPLVNGYSGAGPASYQILLERVVDFPSDAAVHALRVAGVQYLVLHERLYGAARFEAVTRALDARADLRGFGPFREGDHPVRVYRFTGMLESSHP